MNTDLLKSTIEFDTHQFWENSVYAVNGDALFVQHGILNAQEAKKTQSRDNETTTIFNAFFHYNYLIKGEYIITYMKAMILTNYRLFTWYDGTIKSIPLKKLTKYKTENNALSVEYTEDNSQQSFNIYSTWLQDSYVTNAINRRQSDDVSEAELLIAGNLKSVLQAKFAIQGDTYTSQEAPKSYRGLITVCIVVMLFGGCFYYFSSDKESSRNHSYSTTSSYNAEKKTVKCTWCGGVGRVGYAGESEKQVQRTGMGLGNPCIRCGGTGKMNEDADQ